MNNRMSKVWSITAGIIFGISVAATIGLIVMVEQLNMLPIQYLIVLGLAVVFVWAISFLCCFGVPASFKKKAKVADENPVDEKTSEEKPAEENVAVTTVEATTSEVTGGKNKKKYIFRAIGMVLTIALIIVDIVGMIMVGKLQETLSGVTGTEHTEDSEFNLDIEMEKPFIITEDSFVVFISGNDTDYGMDRVRSDVNILAAVNPKTKQVLLIHTPRDYYVEISVAENGERDKLTHCGIYGLECSIDTLSELYDVEIDYFAQVSFNGFIRLINAIGGINVYSEKEFVSWSNKIHFNQGMNYVSGEEALEFVRERKSFGDGDAARGRHQMAVIQGVIDKVSSGALLTNYSGILDSLGECFRCDLTQAEISALVKMQLGDMAEWNIQTYAVKGRGTSNYTYSIPNMKSYVMIPDEGTVEYAGILMDKVFEGEEITEEDLVYSPEKLPTADNSEMADESTETEQ